MHRLLQVSAALGVVALLGCQSVTDPAPRLSPDEPSLAVGGKAALVTGAGHFTYGDEWRTFAITAQRRADGTVTGEVQINNRDQDRKSHGDVLCVGTFGPRAFVGVQITRSDDPNLVGQYGILLLIDNGEGSAAPPDQVTLLNFQPQAVLAGWCAGLYANPFPLYPIEAGNIQVR